MRIQNPNPVYLRDLWAVLNPCIDNADKFLYGSQHFLHRFLREMLRFHFFLDFFNNFGRQSVRLARMSGVVQPLTLLLIETRLDIFISLFPLLSMSRSAHKTIVGRGLGSYVISDKSTEELSATGDEVWMEL